MLMAAVNTDSAAFKFGQILGPVLLLSFIAFVIWRVASSRARKKYPLVGRPSHRPHYPERDAHASAQQHFDQHQQGQPSYGQQVGVPQGSIEPASETSPDVRPPI